MMRLRSSLRCSKNVIAPPGSSSGAVICVLGVESGTGSGRMLRVLGRVLGIRDRSSFRRAAIRLDLGWWRFRARGSSQRGGLARLDGGGSGGCFSGFFALGHECLAFQVVHLFLECALKVRRGLAELGHELAQAAGKLGQLLRSENDQDHEKNHDHVRNAQHCVQDPSNGPMSMIERVLVAVKPELTVCYTFYSSCHTRSG